MATRLAVLLAALALGGCVMSSDPTVSSPPSPVSPIAAQAPDVVTDDLLFLREEEKLARDVYLTLGGIWNVPIFANIAASEQTHMDAVLTLLVRRSIPDPVEDDTVGAFHNPVFTELYGQLVALGEGSVLSAMTAGATIEDLDLNDIQAMAARNTARDVARVYDSLACGSRNHLRAFVSQITALGSTYEAQYLSAAEVEEILQASHERCGGSQF